MSELKKYGLFWRDVYVNGARKGASHAVNEKLPPDGLKAVCGFDIFARPTNGGYIEADQNLPDCKKCKAKLKDLYPDEFENHKPFYVDPISGHKVPQFQ